MISDLIFVELLKFDKAIMILRENFTLIPRHITAIYQSCFHVIKYVLDE